MSISPNAIANFSTDVGSLYLFLKTPQMTDIIGANKIINNGFSD